MPDLYKSQFGEIYLRAKEQGDVATQRLLETKLDQFFKQSSEKDRLAREKAEAIALGRVIGQPELGELGSVDVARAIATQMMIAKRQQDIQTQRDTQAMERLKLTIKGRIDAINERLKQPISSSERERLEILKERLNLAELGFAYKVATGDTGDWLTNLLRTGEEGGSTYDPLQTIQTIMGLMPQIKEYVGGQKIETMGTKTNPYKPATALELQNNVPDKAYVYWQNALWQKQGNKLNPVE